ncbi:gastrokine-1-like [Lissotriton helveticus]
MKTLILTAALLGVFLTHTGANDDINVSNQGNVGGDVHQAVNINNQDNVANINNFNGWDSWDAILDYNRGLYATRVFSKKACIVTKMNKAVFPTLAQLSKAVQEKKASGDAPPRKVTYAVIHTPVKDVSDFGGHIESMCRGLPTYSAAETQGSELFSGYGECSSSSIITILGITMCW